MAIRRHRGYTQTSEIGTTGLSRQSGYIREEFLPQLEGRNGIRIYREMSDNDPTVRSALRAIDLMVRQTKWSVEPASNDPIDKDAAEFVNECMHDMYHTWEEFVSEAMSMIVFGYSVHEVVYKYRNGAMPDKQLKSKYSDGLLGWKGLPIRSQDSIYRWDFNENGYVEGVIQNAPPYYNNVYIPASKLLMFRTSSLKNNPEGQSILRGAYRPWFFKRRIEEIEAIGIERDLAGFPVMYADSKIMAPEANEDDKQTVMRYEQVLRNLRQDSQQGLIIPSLYDHSGNQLYRLELLTSGGSRTFDTSRIIERYDHQIARTMLADFILLGQASHGSYAMHEDKTTLFNHAIKVWVDIIRSQMNDYAIPELLRLNMFSIEKTPELKVSEVEPKPLTEVGTFLQQMAGAGAPLFPNEELTSHLMDMAQLPYNPESVDYAFHDAYQNELFEPNYPQQQSQPQPMNQPRPGTQRMIGNTAPRRSYVRDPSTA